MEDNKYKVGISLGDYNGIGPEVIIKTLEDEKRWPEIKIESLLLPSLEK